MRRLFILLLFLCWYGLTQGQPICKIRTFTIDDGLSQSFVQRLFQDDDGLLWMCTWNGLDSYDGYSFTNYNSSSKRGEALTTNRITIISPTQSGNIWCRTYDGRVYLFDKGTHTFIDVLAAAERKLGHTVYIEKLNVLKNGITWLLGRDGFNFRVDEARYAEPDGITLYSRLNGKLKGDQVWRVNLDKEGDEWILTDQGVTIVGQKQWEDKECFSDFKEKSNKIFLFSDAGRMAVYDKQTQKTEYKELPAGCGKVRSVSGLPNGYVGVATTRGFLLYSIEQKTFRRYDSVTAGASDDYVSLYYNDRECWVLTADSEVLRVNLNTLERRDYRLPAVRDTRDNREGRSIVFEDKNSTLWVIPRQGAMCYYDEDADDFKIYLQDDTDPSSFFDPYIRFYTFDRQGNLWFASHTGVVKLSFLPHFYSLRSREGNMDIRAFLQDREGRLWVGSQSGIVRIYGGDGQKSRYLSPDGRVVTGRCTFPAGTYTFLQDRQGDIWIGTKGSGLYHLQPTASDRFKVTHYRHEPGDPYSLGSDNIYSLYEDRKGRIWIGSFGKGLNLLIRDQGHARFIHAGNDWKDMYPVSGEKVRYLTAMPDDILLIGTHEGLITLSTRFDNPRDIHFYVNRRRANDAASLSSDDVMHVYRDKQGAVYALTFAGGINRVLSDNLLSDSIRFARFGQEEGLNSNLVHSMLEDEAGNLWVISENMLSKYDSQSRLFVNYGSSTFRPGLKFSEAIPLPVAEDRFLVGANQGVLEINPDKLDRQDYVPSVVFTGMRIQGRPLQSDLNRMSQLVLTPSQRNITFSFSAIDMLGSQDIRYAYRLRGVEDSWNEVGETRTAGYTKLPAGTYTLEVKSTNSNGVWMDNVRSLTLVVEPTFGETVWAWLLYALLFVALVAVIVFVVLYIYRLRHRIDVEQQLADIKLRFFTDISHELRTPLTLISGPVDEVLHDPELSPRSRASLTLVHNNVVRMLRLMTQILDFRKIQNKKMKVVVEETELVAFLKQLMLNFRSLAEEQNVVFDLHADQPEVVLWLDRDKADKIFFNLVSNAFKYTPAGKSVTVAVRTTGDYVEVTVADEGVGIEPDKRERLFRRFENFAKGGDFWKPSSGIGLSLVKEMVELHHGTISVDSTPGEGSRFMVCLPLKRALYDDDREVEFILNDGRAAVCEEVDEADNVASDAIGEAELGDRFTVLVVEDNEELRRFLVGILCDRYRVIEAADGSQGLEAARASVPDLVITDVMMPVMDGLELVKQLKLDRNVCHIPVIILSAKASLDDRIAGLEEGIDDYITKPFSATYLKTRIASLLRRQKQLQEVYMERLQMSGTPSSSVGETGEKSDYTPSEPHLLSLDEQFIRQVIEFLEQNISNPEIKIEDFADHLYLSRTVFYRKLKTVTGLTPVEFVREIRLKRAIQLMDADAYTVAQVAYMTGFGDPNYFGRCFKKKTGMTPTEYKSRLKA